MAASAASWSTPLLAKTVVPYWTKINDLYSNLGNAALAAPPK